MPAKSAIARALLAVAHHLPQPRVIYDRFGREPYLSRYYLVGRPTTTNGSDPFDLLGNPRDGIVWPSGPGLYLHRVHQSDSDLELHNHPWQWAAALILSGGYHEERLHADGKVRVRMLRPGQINWIASDTYHRVQLRGAESWSLIAVGPKASSWGFLDPKTGACEGWRTHLERRQLSQLKREIDREVGRAS
jgi:hypothetical protein